MKITVYETSIDGGDVTYAAIDVDPDGDGFVCKHYFWHDLKIHDESDDPIRLRLYSRMVNIVDKLSFGVVDKCWEEGPGTIRVSDDDDDDDDCIVRGKLYKIISYDDAKEDFLCASDSAYR
jgi:hypothetical protein